MDPETEQVFDQKRADELWFHNRLLFSGDHRHFASLIIHDGGTNAPVDKNITSHTSPFALRSNITIRAQNIMCINHTPQLPEKEKYIFKLARPFLTIDIMQEIKTGPAVIGRNPMIRQAL